MSCNSHRADRGSTGHWYDFICPFCYVGQTRSELLRQAGIDVQELPFEAHPDIPPEGVEVGPRSGAIYERLAIEARNADLELRWPAHLPKSRKALAAAAWISRWAPARSRSFNEHLFAAHFARGENIGERSVIRGCARELGVDDSMLGVALADGSAERLLLESEQTAQQAGVVGTPAWLIGDRLINGLRPKTEFQDIARSNE